MIRERDLSNLLRFLENLSSLDVDRYVLILRELLDQYKNWSDSPLAQFPRLSMRINKDKKQLIGKLPFILMESKYFTTNQALVELAKRLNVNIPKNWEKRSKEEIIGRIIASVSKFEPNKLRQMNLILDQLINVVEAGTVNDFFLEWDKAIKQLK